MKKQLKQILTYTTLESSVYQSALLVHQMMLYRYITPDYYGVIGTAFSLIYLGALYLNMGLDLSIAPLFAHTQESQVRARQLLVQLGLNIVLGAFICLFLSIIPIGSTLNQIEACLCGLLILTESTKKTLKTILHLISFHRYIAITENITLGLYILAVWGYLLTGHTPSMPLLCAPLLAISVLCICLYSYPLAQWHRALDTAEQDTISWRKIINIRIQSFIYQISHSLYSPNFLIPIIATQNIALAGFLKMISMVAYAINSIIQHAFGITSSILFAYLKEQPLRYKRLLFHALQRYLYRTILIVIVGITLHYCIMPLATLSITKEHMYTTYLFLLLICLQHIALMHEQFFIIEECTAPLILSNLVLFIPIILVHSITSLSVLVSILLLLSMRFMHLILVHIYGRHHWHLQISWPAKPLYLSLSVTCILMYLFFA